MKRIPIPVPRFIVLYNGNERYPEHGVQKLSDSFVFQQENPQLELKVDIYNINYEVNAEIVRRSRSLNEYSQFIGKIKANLAEGLVLEEAIKQAIEYGIDHDLMKDFLEAHGSEVANMLLSGWNMDEALAVSKEEGYEDGFEDGFENGFEDGEKLGLEKGEKQGEQKKQRELILALKGVLSPEVIAEKFQVSLEYVMAVLSGASMVSEPDTVEYKAE